MNDTLLKADEQLLVMDWPSLQKIDVPSLKASDLYLVCVGFEDRAIETLHRICEAGSREFSLVLVNYRPEYKENRREEILEIARRADLTVHEIVYDRENPAGIGKELDFSADRIFVDISGMSRLLIVQVLVALIGIQERAINIIYGEAAEYFPSKEQFERDQANDDNNLEHSYLSSGIFEIAIAPELSSVSMLGEAIRLIAFPSLDHVQLTNVMQELQPTYAEFIDGIPPDEGNEWRTEAIRIINHRTISAVKNPVTHQASTLDYRKTLKILLDIYEERSMFDRLVIAPTGSKMQAVAVGLLRSFLDDVQIVYPTPHIFTHPKRYTSGLSQIYEVHIPSKEILAKLK